ncbi:hypothetical protein LMH87_010033 [Akanthomyces muscarius]|uniref:DUF4246 domain-containing protein n=1 Tax=Akanthomyces muscarius TaxID=2231603 RepID=A0A9W8UK43_AKAMU|nr:hypothetical protein LMH87_010033 [Akanthomyces muscarius]KAJ4153549.1 hypothetical protein LMH87_010033 [Akanthomyces muscarius]
MAQRARRSSFFAETEGDGEDNVQFDNIGRQELAWSTDSPRKRPALLPPKVDHKFYTLSIEKNFAGKGLQIIVEIGSIELTPGSPD